MHIRSVFFFFSFFFVSFVPACRFGLGLGFVFGIFKYATPRRVGLAKVPLSFFFTQDLTRFILSEVGVVSKCRNTQKSKPAAMADDENAPVRTRKGKKGSKNTPFAAFLDACKNAGYHWDASQKIFTYDDSPPADLENGKVKGWYAPGLVRQSK